MESAKPRLLDATPARRRILEIIRLHPGVSVSELARLANVYWTSAALHAARLERSGAIVSVVVGRRRSLFPSSLVTNANARAVGLLAEPACRRVALAIARNPERRVWELCNLLNMSERAVYHHVKRLVDEGLVATRKRGAYMGLHATPTLLALAGAEPDGRDPSEPPRTDLPRRDPSRS